MFDMKKCGSRIANLRKEKGVSVLEAAQEINVSVSSFNKYEQGLRIPREEVRERIADYFNVSVYSIFYA